MQQNGTLTDYSPASHETGSSWSILSPIELSIKRKIEAVGKPLKDWDIKIYRGILTGCNEAFIIDGAKREEILNKCRSAAERERTDALIRPILRGRDIKRYSYTWANLYLIATFPSRHYNIDDYPAVKEYLLSFGKERLEQTGKEYIVNGERIKARKKTGNKWFETQDSISYWEDFLKQKIVWARLMRMAKSDIDNFPRFSTAESGIYVVDSLCFFTGKNIDKLCFVLNSEYAAYYFFGNVAVLDNGGFQMRQQYVENIPIPDISKIDCEEDVYTAFSFPEEEKSYIKAVVARRKEEIVNGSD